ncbi:MULTISPECIES: dihydrofolate reductase family protein [unclassified Pseudoalteromonas]|uniref:dihydrofolate reductase family protein n=1 Tax=unclassified Pseudoalteromonas TaxID=194690 RepID=UPI000C06FE6D|nr:MULTISPECIES: dihydrofolate reductase family protein [unclassified Pseudoalteromonas]MDP2634575.1 dihydrofolate reductase family protein [Pseudoalteromonas sp. 1_MG-2023]PHN91115.1 diacylglycerol kinase [Pseudoalteromonas sp. 3D05]TGE81446.1 diacylglycerol kinase [Pseudoalteromonas sp. KS88]
MTNKVFIATSLDGYIAGKNNELDWLEVDPAPESMDMGYQAHVDSIDALVMGKNTMELIAAMDIDWPYDKPVFVLSRTLKALPKKLSGKVFLVNDDIKSIEQAINKQGYKNLYIDGGLTIQSFLNEDLIDEMVITTIPILLGGGLSLFGALASSLDFRCIEAKTFTNGVSQNHYKRCR